MGVTAGSLILFQTGTDTYTTTSTGVILNCSTNPFSTFTISVSATGSVTSWNVVLEGSLDGVNFSTILSHTNSLGSGSSVFSGNMRSQALYFRSNCTALTLGSGTNIIVSILGAP